MVEVGVGEDTAEAAGEGGEVAVGGGGDLQSVISQGKM